MRHIFCFLPVVVLSISLWSSSFGADRLGKEVDMFFPPPASSEIVNWKSYSEDPDAKFNDVWTVVKVNPAKAADNLVICKGSPKGYIYTARDYTNFVLKLQWRWPPGKKPGNGGVLVRMTGKHKIWPKSLEAQINVGDAGDFWGLDGYKFCGPSERTKSLHHDQFGDLINLKKIKAAEKPPGEWNQYEITVNGPMVTLVINGRPINKATGCDVTPGSICLTAEGDEIHFRNVRLRPIK